MKTSATVSVKHCTTHRKHGARKRTETITEVRPYWAWGSAVGGARSKILAAAISAFFEGVVAWVDAAKATPALGRKRRWSRRCWHGGVHGGVHKYRLRYLCLRVSFLFGARRTIALPIRTLNVPGLYG